MFIFLIIVKVDNWFQFTPTWMNFLNRVRKFIHNCSHGFFCCFGPKQSIHVYEVSIFCKFLESHPAMSTFATSPTAFNTVRSNIKPSVLSPSLPKPPPPESSFPQSDDCPFPLLKLSIFLESQMCSTGCCCSCSFSGTGSVLSGHNL